MDSIIEAFPHLKDINNRNPDKDLTTIERARCFMLRSNCDDNIHKGLKYLALQISAPYLIERHTLPFLHKDRIF